MKLIPENINEAIKHLPGISLEDMKKDVKTKFHALLNNQHDLYLADNLDELLNNLVDGDWPDYVEECGNDIYPLGATHSPEQFISDKIISKIDKNIIKEAADKVINEIIDFMFIKTKKKMYESIKHLQGKSMQEINKAIEDALNYDNPVDAMEFLSENGLLEFTSTHKVQKIIEEIEKLPSAFKFNNGQFLTVLTAQGNQLMIINMRNYHCYVVGLFAAKQTVEALSKLL